MNVSFKQIAYLVFKNWKSTATGFLTSVSLCLMAAVGSGTGVLFSPVTTAKIVVVNSIITALISGIKKDAGKEMARLPGESEPVLVDSHETPNDPTATVVK